MKSFLYICSPHTHHTQTQWQVSREQNFAICGTEQLKKKEKAFAMLTQIQTAIPNTCAHQGTFHKAQTWH